MDVEGYEIYGGVEALLSECKEHHVVAVVANGVDKPSNRKVLDLAQKHAIIKPALGIYPMNCLEMIERDEQEEFDEEIRFIEEQIQNKKCIAIGEIGLEYKEVKDLDEHKKNIQKTCLKKFIALGKKYHVPMLFHSRGAELELIEFLEENHMKHEKVIMHCFSGRKHLVQRVRDNGWSFSIPCNLDRSEHFQKIVEETPLTQLFTETDSPYLSPIPGKVNRPDNVRLTIKKIADIKGMDEEEVANILYNNYQKMF
jgi:TatD DNase family protein